MLPEVPLRTRSPTTAPLSSTQLLFLMKFVFACLRVDEEPPPALLLRIIYEELEPLVFSAPGIPEDRLVDVLILPPPLLLLAPLTPFLIELFKLLEPEVITIFCRPSEPLVAVL